MLRARAFHIERAAVQMERTGVEEELVFWWDYFPLVSIGWNLTLPVGNLGYWNASSGGCKGTSAGVSVGNCSKMAEVI